MHAPRRSHALSRVPVAPDAAGLHTSSPASEALSNDAPLELEQLCHSRRTSDCGFAVELHSLVNPKYLSPRAGRSTDAPAVMTHMDRIRQLSPRALWRAPAPRRVPLPILLPVLPTPRSARSSKPVGAARVTARASLAPAKERGPSTELSETEAEKLDNYGGEYVRIVFDSSRSTSMTMDAALTLQLLQQQPQERMSLMNSNRLPPVTSLSSSSSAAAATHRITDTEATAALEQLPDHLSLRSRTPTPTHDTFNPGALSAAAYPSPNYVPEIEPSATTSSSPQTQLPQPEAWWSTLDGTLSAYNSLRGTTYFRSALGAGGASYQSLTVQAQNSPAQNLNDTLGRADRAAMVLSMGRPQRSPDATRTAESSPLLSTPARNGGGTHTAKEENECVAARVATEPVAATVAALTTRLSHAAEKNNCSTNINAAKALIEKTASTLVHQNTIQELRDTLLMTETDMLGFQEQQQQLLCHGTETSTSALGDSSLSLDDDSSYDSRQPPVNTKREDYYSVPLVPIVKPAQTHSYRKEAGSLKTPGLGGGGGSLGTKRTRDALVRLYAAPNSNVAINTSAAASNKRAGFEGVTTSTSTPQRNLSFLSRPGPSFAAPAPPISTDSETRAMPWECEALTLDTVKRMFGPLEAAHVAHPRGMTRRKQRRQPTQVHKSTSSAAQNSRAAGHGTQGRSKLEQQRQQQQASSLPSPTSSVSSTVFSCVSLTSSIFVHEIGDGEVLRKSHISMMSGTAAAGATGGKDASSKAPLPPPQQSQLSQQNQRNAAAEAAAAAAVVQYRRDQQRLYAIHLATTSRALACADRKSTDAIEPHLDVEYLFSDFKPRTLNDTPDGKAKPMNETRNAARSPAYEQVKDNKVKNGSHGPLVVSRSSAPHDTLNAALQARQALLRRYVQSSPTWERLLYKVRQWCDRTQVMVQLESGECVEQTGARPPPPLRLTQQPSRQQQVVQRASANSENSTVTATTRCKGSVDVTMGNHSLFTAPTFVTAEDEIISQAKPQHYLYVDDPALAHERLMQQVARETEDVQRHNALQRCRQRQQQYEATLNESTLVLPNATTSSLSSSFLANDSSNNNYINNNSGAGQRLQSHGLGSGRSTGTTLSTWANVSTDSEAAAASSLFVRAEETNVGSSAYDASLPNATQQLGLGPDQTTSTAEALRGRYAEILRNRTDTHAGVVSGQHGIDSARLNPQTMTELSVAPFRSHTVRDQMSQHAALCSKLRTWGEPVEEGTAIDDGGYGDTDASPFEVRAKEHAGTLVQWRSDSAALLGEAGGEANQRLLSTSTADRVKRFSVQFFPTGARVHPIRPLARTSSFHCSSVEKDLLAFVLTCGSSSHTSSSAASCGLSALLVLPGRPASELQSSVGSGNAVLGAQETLKALQSMLHDGFGVPALSEADSPSSASEKSGPKQHLGKDSGAEVEDEGQAPQSLAWEALITVVLNGYNAFDLKFLKYLHKVLWTYEVWRKKEGQEKAKAGDGVRRQHDVTILPTMPAFTSKQPPPVWPLTVFTSNTANGSTVFNSKSFGDAAGEGRPGTFSVTIDAADLFCALASAPMLVLWLLDAHQSSPTSTWIDIVDAMPAKQQQEWHVVVAGNIESAFQLQQQFSTGTAVTTAATPPRPSLSAQPSQDVAEGHGTTATPLVFAFICEVSVAVSTIVWRQRVFHSLLKQALACVDAGVRTEAATTATATGGRVTSTFSTSCFELQRSFPTIGSTPYLPDEEGRVNYPLDMRNGYLFSSLAREDVENRVVPQLRETRRQFAEALRAARSAATNITTTMTEYVSPSLLRPAFTLLPLALQQRVHLHRLLQCEHRFVILLSSMWSQEVSICSFNQHVEAFNAFTRAEQRRWGPLYRSSLTVAYCVCQELAEKKMENLSPELLPFVSLVAAFMGCSGGHRELRTKLPTVMLELVERAKRVQVHLDSLSWQGRRAQLLAEAVTAAQVAPRRAGAVISMLATESDVIGVPLTQVALPAVRLRNSLPLPPSEE